MEVKGGGDDKQGWEDRGRGTVGGQVAEEAEGAEDAGAEAGVSRGEDAAGIQVIDTFVDMNMVQQWLDFHVLPCNYSKTNYVLFRVPSKPNLQLSLFMGDAEIERVPEVKFLGIIIDEHLTWASQVNDCCRRLSSAVFGLRSLARVSNYDKQVLLMVYHGLFMSVARYGILLGEQRQRPT